MHVVVMSGPPARRSGDEDAPAAGVNDLPSRRFVLTDEATGQLYALRASGVDLSALVGQRVTVPGFENGKVEGALPLLDVIRMRPL
jgi:hypothetical protein